MGEGVEGTEGWASELVTALLCPEPGCAWWLLITSELLLPLELDLTSEWGIQ